MHDDFVQGKITLSFYILSYWNPGYATVFAGKESRAVAKKQRCVTAYLFSSIFDCACAEPPYFNFRYKIRRRWRIQQAWFHITERTFPLSGAPRWPRNRVHRVSTGSISSDEFDAHWTNQLINQSINF